MSLQKADAQISNQEALTEQDKENIRNGIDFNAAVSSNNDVEANSLKRSYPLADENKLEDIEENAQVNVQSDWNQADDQADDYIKNKEGILKKVSATLPAPDVDGKVNIPLNQLTDFTGTESNAAQYKVDLNNITLGATAIIRSVTSTKPFVEDAVEQDSDNFESQSPMTLLVWVEEEKVNWKIKIRN